MKKYQLSEVYHAKMFMIIGMELKRNFDNNQFESIIGEIVKKYGAQRGARISLWAKKNTHELSMLNYIAYSEFKNKTSIMRTKISGTNGHARVSVTKCPWSVTWQENNAPDIGKYYCQFVDKALVNGFSPELRIDVNSTLTNQGDFFEFIFHDLNVGIASYVKLVSKKLSNPGNRALKPWSFQICHLISVTKEILKEKKYPNGDRIFDNIVDEVKPEFTGDAADEILGYFKCYFTKI